MKKYWSVFFTSLAVTVLVGREYDVDVIEDLGVLNYYAGWALLAGFMTYVHKEYESEDDKLSTLIFISIMILAHGAGYYWGNLKMTILIFYITIFPISSHIIANVIENRNSKNGSTNTQKNDN